MAVCGKCHREAPEGALFCSFCGTGIKPETAAGEVVDPLIGQTVNGKYHVEKLIGGGGMGEVYKATHLDLDRPVVLKLLKKSFLNDPSIMQRFYREARAASRLNHPNSISIIDFGKTEDGTLFMAMEYLSGRSLARVIAEDQPIPEARVVHVAAQILAALAEAHAQGIIHRDLKPENVMLESRRDEADFVKVLDFGIAKLNEPGDAAGKLTQAGIVCGTPGYMSPEQVRGDELDPRSDIYSVGVILYEMLTGKLPFEADTPMGLVTKHLVEAVPPLSVRRPGLHVSPELEALVMRCLAKDRQERPGTAEELRAALLAWAGRGPAVRPTPSPVRTLVMDAAPPPTTPARGESASVKVWRPPTGPAAGAGGQAARPPTPPPPTVAAARTPAPRPLPRTPPPAPALEAGGTVAMESPRSPTAPQAAAQRPSRTTGARTAPPAPSPAVETQDDLPPRPARPARSRVPLVAGVTVAAAAAAALAIFGIYGLSGPPARTEPAAAATEPTVAARAEPPAPPRSEAPGAAVPVPLPPPPAGTALVPTTVETSPAPPAPEPRPEAVVAPPPKPQPSRRSPDRPAKVEKAEKRVAEVTPGPPSREPRGAKGIRSVREELNSIATPPARSGDGVLSVIATPWADVYVDGAKIGETPREMRLGAGTYRLRATHPSLGSREADITIQAGKRRVWNATFAN